MFGMYKIYSGVKIRVLPTGKKVCEDTLPKSRSKWGALILPGLPYIDLFHIPTRDKLQIQNLYDLRITI